MKKVDTLSAKLHIVGNVSKRRTRWEERVRIPTSRVHILYLRFGAVENLLVSSVYIIVYDACRVCAALPRPRFEKFGEHILD